MRAGAGFFWRFNATTSLGGVFFLRCQRRRGGMKPTHRHVQNFLYPSGLLGRRVTSPPCLPPPNNNEGWPPCGVDNRAARVCPFLSLSLPFFLPQFCRRLRSLFPHRSCLPCPFSCSSRPKLEFAVVATASWSNLN